MNAFSSVFVTAAFVLGGCVPSQFYTRPVPLAEQADQFTRAAANAERLMIARNIMAARDRSSMVFTRISIMRGIMASSVSGTTALTLDEGPGNDRLAPGLTIGGTNTPSFDLTPLSGEEFNRAIQSSIDLSIYRLLIEYGWNEELIHTLFIERVEDKNNPDCCLNHPGETDANGHTPFQRWLFERLYTDQSQMRLHLCQQSAPIRYGPPLSLRDADLEGIAAIAAARLRLEPESDGRHWRVSQPRTLHQFRLGDCASGERLAVQRYVFSDGDDGVGPVGFIVTDGADEPAQDRTDNGRVRDDRRRLMRRDTLNNANQAPSDTPRYTIHVRSIQGVLVYLGEVVREQHRASSHVVHTHDGGHVIRIVQGRSSPGLNFQHQDGAIYSIPFINFAEEDPDAAIDRTQQVISLMLQLIGTLQSRKDLPATEAVQVVN